MKQIEIAFAVEADAKRLAVLRYVKDATMFTRSGCFIVQFSIDNDTDLFFIGREYQTQLARDYGIIAQ